MTFNLLMEGLGLIRSSGTRWRLAEPRANEPMCMFDSTHRKMELSLVLTMRSFNRMYVRLRAELVTLEQRPKTPVLKFSQTGAAI
jgi:hypothetical protein